VVVVIWYLKKLTRMILTNLTNCWHKEAKFGRHYRKKQKTVRLRLVLT